MLKRSIIIAAAVASISFGAQASTIDSLKGIEAETLNAVEMQEIQGQISYAELVTRITTSTKLTAVQKDYLLKLAAWANKYYPVLFTKILSYIK